MDDMYNDLDSYGLDTQPPSTDTKLIWGSSHNLKLDVVIYNKYMD